MKQKINGTPTKKIMKKKKKQKKKKMRKKKQYKNLFLNYYFII